MAKANQKDIPALFIRTRHDGVYRRAGFKFSRQGYGIALDALSKEQIKLLKNDPHLVVQECTFPADEDTAEAERLAAEKAAAEKAEAERLAAEPLASQSVAERVAAEKAAAKQAAKDAAKNGNAGDAGDGKTAGKGGAAQ